MTAYLRLGLMVCLLGLSSCMQEEEETSDWFCSYYNNCPKEENTMCGFYGNCPDKGSVWGSNSSGAGSDADSSHVGGMDHTDGIH